MDLIGQLQPHTPVKFRKVGMDEALKARTARKKMLAAVRTHLG